MTKRTASAAHTRSRIEVGAIVPSREVLSVDGGRVRIPDPAGVVHLQFRRFAGCPVCKLHLRSIVRRYGELLTEGVHEVVVFHSTAALLRRHVEVLPFPAIADPDRLLYAEFGVETSVRSVLDPRAWRAIVRGLWMFGRGLGPGESALGLPADFLIGTDGRVLARKYGAHADDHWSVDEILALAGGRSIASAAAHVLQSGPQGL